MQEDVERRTVALTVNAAKLTSRVLAKALAALLRKIQKEYRAGQPAQGKQSVKKLMNHGVTTNALPLAGEIRLFDQVARKYNVDMLFTKLGRISTCYFSRPGKPTQLPSVFQSTQS